MIETDLVNAQSPDSGESSSPSSASIRYANHAEGFTATNGQLGIYGFGKSQESAKSALESAFRTKFGHDGYPWRDPREEPQWQDPKLPPPRKREREPARDPKIIPFPAFPSPIDDEDPETYGSVLHGVIEQQFGKAIWGRLHISSFDRLRVQGLVRRVLAKIREGDWLFHLSAALPMTRGKAFSLAQKILNQKPGRL